MRQRKEIRLSNYANRSPHCRDVGWRRLEIGEQTGYKEEKYVD